MEKISVAIIATNESHKIANCLHSVSWADEIILVDGGSRDDTMEKAAQLGARVHRREFDNFANQKNHALGLATGDWILSLDADEVVNPELKDAIQKAARDGGSFDGFYVHRRNFLFGKELKFGGQRREKILRLFKKGKGRFDQPIHEKIVLQGPVGELPGDLMHYSSGSVEEYLRKLALYTEFEARWMSRQGKPVRISDVCLKPFFRFAYNYIIRLGILDGYEGFLYHALSFFYDVIKHARFKEIESHGQ